MVRSLDRLMTSLDITILYWASWGNHCIEPSVLSKRLFCSVEICCCSHTNSLNQVRGHRTGLRRSGVEGYPINCMVWRASRSVCTMITLLCMLFFFAVAPQHYSPAGSLVAKARRAWFSPPACLKTKQAFFGLAVGFFGQRTRGAVQTPVSPTKYPT